MPFETPLLSPVCGCDMKTYSNQCEAYANGVSVFYIGACRAGIE
ncbi:MAG: Kazal-type serine protease inhibitor domain-containing protein [Thermodesulfovibrionales bacterium]